MLAFYAALARRLHRARPLLWVVAALSVGGFVAALVLSPGTSYLLLSLCVLLWAVCLLVVVSAFSHPMPEIADADGLLARLRIRLARGSRWVFAWVMTGLCVAVVVASLRAAALALRALGS